jgi:hypothetical protein
MKCLCPACRRTTRIDVRLVDFFARCERCGALLRPQRELTERGERGNSSIEMVAKVVRPGRLVEEAKNKRAGELAMLLSRPGGWEVNPVAEEREDEEIRVLMRPLTWSQKRRRKAKLRAHHRTLGIIGMCGSGAAVMMAMGAVVMRVVSTWRK